MKPIDYFRELCGIPHGSFHTEAISEFIYQFALQRGLKCRKDESGNVVVFRPASDGRQKDAPMILQGHMDMVLEKESSLQMDMEKEPIILIEEDGWLHADRTTLGADDGISAAIMMAILDDESISAPALECVFTVDEEVGLLGANALDMSDLKGRRLLNLDSEEEGVFTVGCAGGIDDIVSIPIKKKQLKGTVLDVRVNGLLGGHSGEMIGSGRANAVLLLARALQYVYQAFEFNLLSIEGGSKSNAIPREAQARLLFSSEADPGLILKKMEEITAGLRKEYEVTDPGLQVTAEWENYKYIENGIPAMTGKSTRRILSFINTAPSGVLEYMPVFDRLPQTSLNLGILKTEENAVTALFMVRSSVNSQKDFVTEKLRLLTKAHKGSLICEGMYPAWQYRNESAFRELLVEAYTELTGKKPVVTATHGGLECGVFCGKLPELDCVSIGADMENIHTPAERLSLASFDRTWEFILKILEKA